uniref:YqaJ viral recombinase domain-containing protein n=1 Tax=Streptomyces sp. NBC_00049 TaxID=2903617 RepID=A0AAU2K079_9ACTN
MPGEEEHIKGAEAVQRVKRWLEGTMRVSQSYTNTDGAWARKLTLHWPHGSQRPFSYDLGGMMRGGEWDGQMFCAEVKWRRKASDQGTEYPSFLAKCYVAMSQGYMLGDHFMWITWAPFRANDWDQLTGAQMIRRAVLAESSRIFGIEDPTAAAELVKADIIEELAGRLWLIVMSEKQEKLVPLDDWRGVVANFYASNGRSTW